MKKPVLVIFVSFLISLILMMGCGGVVTGSGHPITETYDYTDFDAIEVHNGFQIDLKKSNNFNIEITVDDNLKEYLQVDETGNTLRIRLQQNRLYSSVTLIAKITMPDINRIDLSGGSRVDVTGFNLSHDLSIELSGGSRINGDISADDVDLEMSGGSRIELGGSADNLVADGSGGSHLELGSFSVGNADIEISGGGRGDFNVSGTLDLDLSGGSHVSYKGDPQIGNIDVSGGSTFEKN
ncbi:head GIN domain-containing protein [Chloroflexota bacterium]